MIEERSAFREAPEALGVTVPGSPVHSGSAASDEEREAAVMDINAVVQAISTVGFPIAACCIMFWYLQQEQKTHKEEMQTMTDALNKNTIILTELKEMIGIITGYGGKHETREA